MEPDCSSFLGSQLWVCPRGSPSLHPHSTAAFLRSQLPRLTQKQVIPSPSLCSWFKHWDFATSTLWSYKMLNQQFAKYITSRSAILSLFCSYSKSVIWPVSVLLEEMLNMFVLLWQFCHWPSSTVPFLWLSTAHSFSYKNWERREKDLSKAVNQGYEAIDMQQKCNFKHLV